MKTVILAAVMVVVAASVADAQVDFRYRREGRNYRLDIRYSSGGCGYGYGYGPRFSGFTYTTGGSSYYSGSGYYGGSYYGGAWGYASGARAYTGWRPYSTGTGYADYVAMNYAAVRRAQVHGVPERLQRLALDRHIDAGMKRWQAADYAGALASFKEAVGTDTSSGLAQVCMGLALVAVGDARNAEKAVAGGIETLDPSAIDLKAMFRDAKEHGRFSAALERVGPLTGALGWLLLGERDKARVRAADVQGPAAKHLDALLRAQH